MVELGLFFDVVEQLFGLIVEFGFVAVDVESSEFDGKAGGGCVLFFIVDSLCLYCQHQLANQDGYA